MHLGFWRRPAHMYTSVKTPPRAQFIEKAICEDGISSLTISSAIPYANIESTRSLLLPSVLRKSDCKTNNPGKDILCVVWHRPCFHEPPFFWKSIVKKSARAHTHTHTHTHTLTFIVQLLYLTQASVRPKSSKNTFSQWFRPAPIRAQNKTSPTQGRAPKHPKPKSHTSSQKDHFLSPSPTRKRLTTSEPWLVVSMSCKLSAQAQHEAGKALREILKSSASVRLGVPKAR